MYCSPGSHLLPCLNCDWITINCVLILLSFSLIIMPQLLPDNVKPPLLQPDNAHLALRLGLEKKQKKSKIYIYTVQNKNKSSR